MLIFRFLQGDRCVTFLVTEFGSDTAKFCSDAVNFGSDVKIAKFSIFFGKKLSRSHLSSGSNSLL